MISSVWQRSLHGMKLAFVIQNGMKAVQAFLRKDKQHISEYEIILVTTVALPDIPVFRLT